MSQNITKIPPQIPAIYVTKYHLVSSKTILLAITALVNGINYDSSLIFDKTDIRILKLIQWTTHKYLPGLTVLCAMCTPCASDLPSENCKHKEITGNECVRLVQNRTTSNPTSLLLLSTLGRNTSYKSSVDMFSDVEKDDSKSNSKVTASDNDKNDSNSEKNKSDNEKENIESHSTVPVSGNKPQIDYCNEHPT